MFFYEELELLQESIAAGGRFQSPEGDSLFFYLGEELEGPTLFLSFQSPEGDSLFFYARAASNRLAQKYDTFQSPEGDSLFFYSDDRSTPDGDRDAKFQSPEGDSLFFYDSRLSSRGCYCFSFSPPKGIHCFSTEHKIKKGR